MTFSIGPYRVIEKLGAGGMGEVFLAEDTRLGRRIALKQLAGTWIAAPDARQRLLREARAAAVLNHPNIAAIYDVVEDGDRACLVMEYVEGENLAQRLRHGPLPPEQVVDIGIQLAEALVEAHARGVLHRDLKPGNIRITPTGKVKILDFGIAKLQQATSTGQTEPVTGPGQILGTPGYTAPEQLRGRPVDQRADIYSLGVVLFELLTGRLPIEGTDIVSLALATLKENPPTPSDVDARIPSDLSAAVAHALYPDRAKRTQSAGELLAALRAAATGFGERPTAPVTLPRTGRVGLRSFGAGRVLAAAAIVIVAASSIALFWRRDRPATGPVADARVPVVAVLPFSNLSGDPSKDYLGIGIAATVASTLGRVSAMSVVARPEILQARQQSQDARAIAARLSATHIVDGGVQPSGNRLRIAVKLTRADGTPAWERSFEAAEGEVLALQTRIAEGLSSALRIRLSGDDRQRLAGLRSHNPAAVAEYWSARALLERPDVPGNVARAVTTLERVVTTEPAFADAKSALAEAYWARYNETTDIAWTQKAIDASLAALRVDPAAAAVRHTLAAIYLGTGRRDQAVTELRRAIALQPNTAEAYVLLGSALADGGKVDQGVEQFHKAIALRPGYARAHSALGGVLWRAGRNAEAALVFRKVTELQPDSAWAFQQLGTVYHTIGDTDRALANYERSLQLAPNARTYSNVGTIHYERGKYAEAARAYESAIGLAPTAHITRRNLGDAYRRLGRTEAARMQYEQALQLARERLRVNPKDADVLAQSAVYEAKLGRSREGRQHADAAIALNPTSGRLHYYRAVVLALAGSNQAAIEALSEAVRRGYPASRAREDDDLARLHGTPAFEAALAQKP